MRGYLLDSTALIDLLDEWPEAGDRIPGTRAAAGLCASIVSKGELMVGAYMLQGPNHTPDEFVSELGNVKRLFADLTAVYPVTDETTALYGRLQAQLILQGKRKLTINDGWIAATALEHRLTLVTSDQRLKDLGDLLRIEDWRV